MDQLVLEFVGIEIFWQCHLQMIWLKDFEGDVGNLIDTFYMSP